MRPPKPTSGGGGRGGEGTFTRAFPSCETTARDTTGAAVTTTPVSPVVCTRSSVAASTVPAASMSRARAAWPSASLQTGKRTSSRTLAAVTSTVAPSGDTPAFRARACTKASRRCAV